MVTIVKNVFLFFPRDILSYRSKFDYESLKGNNLIIAMKNANIKC